MAYLTRWRLQLGAQMLVSTSYSVAQIASEVGYESEAAFNRAFKREFENPPARFRSQSRSLLKLAFVQRADHFMIACRAWLIVVCSAAARLLVPWQPRVGPRVSRGLRQQFRDADQVEGSTAEHEQPIHLRQSA